MRIVIFIISYLFCNASSLAGEVLPPFCKPIALHGETILLNSDKPRLVLFHNLSKTDVWIIQPDIAAETNDMPLSTQITPNQWAALAIDQSATPLQCIESSPGHEQQLACEQALAVCEWSLPQLPKERHGAFFAAESSNLTPLTAYLGRFGFELPQKAQ